MKYVLILSPVTLITLVSSNLYCMGCVTEIKGSDFKRVEETLKKSLTKLAAGEGPSYEFVEINYATTQVVVRTNDKMNAELKDKEGNKKTCEVQISSQPWMKNGKTVTIKCLGEQTVIKHYSV